MQFLKIGSKHDIAGEPRLQGLHRGGIVGKGHWRLLLNEQSLQNLFLHISMKNAQTFALKLKLDPDPSLRPKTSCLTLVLWTS